MKRIALVLLSLVYCLIHGSCSSENIDIPITYYPNKPLPVGKQRLKLLVIGNSYGANATQHLKLLTRAAGIADSTFSVYLADYHGAKLEYWWEAAKGNEAVKLRWRAGAEMPVESGRFSDVVAQDWDVITLQQYSGYSDSFSTFNPYLQNLIEWIRKTCTNPDVALVWHMTWAYADGRNYGEASEQQWFRICQTTQQMMKANGIDLIIPSGTAIQNARNTSLQTASDLTYDGIHLDRGVGCYTASCTFFEALFMPVYGMTVLGNPSTVEVSEEYYPQDDFPSSPVTEKNRELCQRCAVEAVRHPFGITWVEGR